MAELKKRSIDTVLLTGATGYVGIHLLYELMAHTNAMVTCLVRAPDAEAGKARVRDTFAWYFPDFDRSALERRVAIEVGDIGSERLGLTERSYDRLAQARGVIVNCAAGLGRAGTARAFHNVNVEGVARLAEFARTSAAELHHVSTISVAGLYRERPTFKCFEETQLEEGQGFSSTYSETKHQAEVLMNSHFRSGLKGAVYRLGFVAPHGVTGRFQRNIHQNHRVRTMRAIVKLGVAPFEPTKSIRMTPVDSVAKAILTLVTARTSEAKTYHIQTPQEVSERNIIDTLHAVGYPIRLLEPGEFADKVRQLAPDNDDILKGNRRPKDGVSFSVPLNGDWSVGELSRLGFEYPRVSSAWFGRFLNHCIGVGFLEAPRFWALGKIVDRQW